MRLSVAWPPIIETITSEAPGAAIDATAHIGIEPCNELLRSARGARLRLIAAPTMGCSRTLWREDRDVLTNCRQLADEFLGQASSSSQTWFGALVQGARKIAYHEQAGRHRVAEIVQGAVVLGPRLF